MKCGRLGILVALSLVAAMPAIGAEPPDGAVEQFAVDLSPILTVVVQLAAALVLGVGTWALKKWGKKLGVEEDSKVREYVNQALENGVRYAAAKAQAAGQDLARVEVKNKMVADALNYVVPKVPDGLKKLGITEQAAKDILTAKIQRDVPVTR